MASEPAALRCAGVPPHIESDSLPAARATRSCALPESALRHCPPRRFPLHCHLSIASSLRGPRPLRQTNYEFPPRVTRRPAGKTPAAEPDPRCVGHVRLRARDGASGRPEPTGRNPSQDGDPAAASRESAVADRGNDRRNAELHRTGQRRHRGVHRASSAVPAHGAEPPSSSASPAGRSTSSCEMAARLDGKPGIAALELNISCPNVTGGVDFGTDADSCRRLVAGVRSRLRLADPGEADSQRHANRRHRRAAAADGGADAVCLINTVLGMADRLAAATAAAGKRRGRAERSGDQADCAAVRLSGRPGRADSRWSASAASPRSTT